MRCFLIGGGRGDDAAAAHEPFARAVTGPGPVIVYLLDEPGADPDRWATTLGAAGVAATRVVAMSPARPPRPADVEGAAGVYVAGGLTPGYREVLVDPGTGWLAAARAAGLPYAGFSAGAAVAATRALVGGWRTTVDGRRIAVCDEDFGEDLDPLTVLPGLDLVPFLVDVHAAQWGILNRLLHAVLDPSGPGRGWAIDEHTTLETLDGVPVAVHGAGAATQVRRTGGGAEVTVHVAGPVP